MQRLAPILFITACSLVSACGSGDDDASGTAAQGGTHAAGGAGGTSTTGGTDATGGTSATGGSSGTTGGDGNAGTSTQGGGQYFGDAHSGNFWLGPVDYAETEWHNACAPSVKYPPGIQTLYGDYIMGLANEVMLEGLSASSGELCDTCVELTANGMTLVAHAVTYGQETGPNDIDVSPQVDQALDSASGRSVSWRFTSCATDAPVQYTFDGRQWSNVYFFRVWVRNARVPLKKLEYRVGSGSYSAADWQTDGAFQASSADFSNGFSVRVTAVDGQTLEDDLPGLNTFDPNVGVTSHGNFD